MSEEEIATLYCDLMEELKARVSTISEVVWGIMPAETEQHLRHNVFVLEGLYLQLRKCCELLAASVVVSQANDARVRVRSLFGEYRADKMLDRLANISPSRFPRPVGHGEWVAGEIGLVSEYPPVFTEGELRELYYICDERMHWGRISELQKGKVRELRQDAIQGWVTKLLNGLQNHIIALPQTGRSMLVQMTDPETGRVCTRFATLAA